MTNRIVLITVFTLFMTSTLSAGYLSRSEQQDLFKWLVRLDEDLDSLENALRLEVVNNSQDPLSESLLTHEGNIFKQWRLAPLWRNGMTAIHDCIEPHLELLDETRAQFNVGKKKFRFTDLSKALDKLSGRIEMDLGKPTAKERRKALENLSKSVPVVRAMATAVLEIVRQSVTSSTNSTHRRGLTMDMPVDTPRDAAAPGFGFLERI